MLSVLLVSFNTREDTLIALDSVFAETRETEFEVIVVDNDSVDGSADAIHERFGDRVRLIRSDINLGFAAANNLAASHASGEYLLLLNPDTIVLKGAIDTLVRFAQKNPDAGVWGGRTVFADGALNPGSCWGRPTIRSSLCQATGLATMFARSTLTNPEGLGGWRRDSVRAVDVVSGCFLMIRRRLWDMLGGFDTAFFMYGEDTDLCLRARVAGARPLICPDATIVHHGGRSEKVRAEKVIRLYRAKMQLIDRHWVAWARPFGRALQLANVLRRTAVFALRHWSEPNPFLEVWNRRGEWQQAPATAPPSVPGMQQTSDAGIEAK